MAHRYWKLHENMGYAGTSSTEEIDLVDHWGYPEEDLADLDDEYVREELSQFAWEQACDRISAWAEPIDK